MNLPVLGTWAMTPHAGASTFKIAVVFASLFGRFCPQFSTDRLWDKNEPHFSIEHRRNVEASFADDKKTVGLKGRSLECDIFVIFFSLNVHVREAHISSTHANQSMRINRITTLKMERTTNGHVD
ncbi:hypothetical protein [Sinorhizobium fredii]|uniref:hypothetical protein n=1 Tax=Rhizobium fredii TaxID=380 RepID=UPI0033962B91